MSFKLYTDTHIAKAVAVQLRAKGIDTIRCEEVDMADASDEEHLEKATSQERVMVSQDDDFLKLDSIWQKQGRHHTGIFFVNPNLRGQGTISVIVREVIELHELIEGGAGTLEDDIINTINYIG